jgi:activator of HSP90 ATPase
MPFDVVDVSTLLPVAPEEVWAAWVDGPRHTAMTGAPATCDARPGGAFTAWDGYNRGTNLVLEPSHRIVQSWRTSQFSATDADSRLEILITSEDGGTRIRLLHTNIPAGQGPSYAAGWEQYYFAPMRRYFAAQ